MRKPSIFALALAAVTAMSACSATSSTETSAPQALSYAEGKGDLDISVLRTAEHDFPHMKRPRHSPQIAPSSPPVSSTAGSKAPFSTAVPAHSITASFCECG
jgi:outer membrane protein assembly factor BamD (BamD/ComL family)